MPRGPKKLCDVKNEKQPERPSLNVCGHRARSVLPKKILENGKKKRRLAIPKPDGENLRLPFFFMERQRPWRGNSPLQCVTEPPRSV
jgi:hypothetical protein